MPKKISDYTELAALPADGDFFLLELAANGSYRKIKYSNVVKNDSITSAKLAAGVAVQVVSTDYSAVSTGTTTIPFDDTLPQNTEGDEYMSQAIVPKSASNILVVEANLSVSSSIANYLVAALFRDATASAKAAEAQYQSFATGMTNLKLTYAVAAGSTNSTTFKVRAGGTSAGTTTFNGSAGSRAFGATTKSSIKITEVKVS